MVVIKICIFIHLSDLHFEEMSFLNTKYVSCDYYLINKTLTLSLKCQAKVKVQPTVRPSKPPSPQCSDDSLYVEHGVVQCTVVRMPEFQ